MAVRLRRQERARRLLEEESVVQQGTDRQEEEWEMDILTWLIVGLVAGVLASFVAGGGFGLLGDIVVGILGAFVGGWLFRQMGWGTPFGGLAGTIFVAFIGAVVLLLLLRLIRRG